MTNDRPAAAPDPARKGEHGPALRGRSVHLRPVSSDDYAALHHIETVGDMAWRWRQGGRTRSPEDFVRTMWAGVLAQFIVTRNQDPAPLGLVIAYGADHENGHCQVGFLKFSSSSSPVEFVSGISMFVDYLLHYWSFRKLYGEARESNLEQFRSLVDIGLMTIEGRLTDHVHRDGSYEDLVIVSLRREDWFAGRDGWNSIVYGGGAGG